jgi:hypothetical protein
LLLYLVVDGRDQLTGVALLHLRNELSGKVALVVDHAVAFVEACDDAVDYLFLV